MVVQLQVQRCPQNSGVQIERYLIERYLALPRLIPTLQDLHLAIRSKDRQRVQRLATHSAIKINSNLRSCTALSLAVYQGNCEIVEILLQAGAIVDQLSKDWNGRIETPLFSACQLGFRDIVDILLRHGASVNLTDYNNQTPLWIATRERNIELVQLLLAYNANLDIPNKWSQSPLYLAVKYTGRLNIAKILIQHGCKLDATDQDGYGALYWSHVNRDFELFRLLVLAGAHVTLLMRNRVLRKESPNEEDQELSDWLKFRVQNASSLLHLATIAVRKQLSAVTQGTSIIGAIDILPLPAEMKHTLKLNELIIQ